jgi:hypothetical protein
VPLFGSALGYPRRRPHHGSTRGEQSSLRLWLPFRVSPVHHRAPVRDPEGSRWLTPSEVSSPSASSQPRGATYLRWVPSRRLCCALRVSHPLGALLPSWPPGLVPSRSRSWGLTLRGLSPHVVPYVLSNAVALGVSPRPSREEAAPPGTPTLREAHPQAWVLARWLRCVPPWACVLRGFLPQAAKVARRTLASPHALFRVGRKLTAPPAPQGFIRLGRSRSLSRSASLLAVSHLVGLPGAFRLAEQPYR